MSLPFMLWCIAALLGIAVLPVLTGGARRLSRYIYGAAAIVCAMLLATALGALLGLYNFPADVRLPLAIPWVGAYFRLDPLAAFFSLVINLGGMTAAVYALGYGRHEQAPQRVLPFFTAFIAGMNLVLLAADAFTFLFAWELMSLTSWALVMAHHRGPGNVRAGYIYLLMATFGTLALLLAFGVLAGPADNFSFDSIRAATHTGNALALVLLLVILGAGSKAGMVPLHVWLPLAHPAAPSHVSALMSGVMTKVAVYGFIRIVMDLPGLTAWWTGLFVLLLGGVTAVMGVLYALMQHDLKRLLAYHTVENIGIVFIGVGLAMAFQANSMGAAAALAMTAALFHVLNHSLFKSLLFFGAGAVQVATGKLDMEELGGLIHRMPVTAFLFLVGCAAISALPPLNGFVSEWLTFQAVLQSPDLPQWALKFAVPAAGALLALAAALAAACFVKVYGITFLGRPRSDEARNAVEIDRFSLSAMGLFALLCVLAGVFPGFVMDTLSPVVHSFLGNRAPVQESFQWLTIVPISESQSSYSGMLVLAFILSSASLAAFAIHRLASHKLRRAPAWDCGNPDDSPVTQYTAGSFAQPIRRVFGSVVFRASEEVDIPLPGEVRPARLTVELRDPVWDTLYAPVRGAVDRVAAFMNRMQFLTIRRYLGLVFLALVMLLLVVAIWL